MDYQTRAAICPKCGSSDRVHTARELFDMMSGSREQAYQRLSQFRRPGQAQGQGQGQSWNGSDDDDYDHYNVEGSDPGLRRNTPRRGSGFDFDSGGDGIVDDIGGAVLGAALGFAGRAIGRRMKRAFEQKITPAIEARLAQAQQHWEQSKPDEDAIVARYPELRVCLKDQVIFLDGGYRTVPAGELRMPVTLAQADEVVARLR